MHQIAHHISEQAASLMVFDKSDLAEVNKAESSRVTHCAKRFSCSARVLLTRNLINFHSRGASLQSGNFKSTLLAGCGTSLRFFFFAIKYVFSQVVLAQIGEPSCPFYFNLDQLLPWIS